MNDKSVEIQIRRLGRDDEAVLGQVAEGVFDEAIDPRRLTAYLAAPGHLMIVAMAEDIVVGQVAAVIHRHPDKPTELYIDEVGTADAWLRQGIATRMLHAMFALGRELGCEEAWLGTEPDNAPARALYDRLGVPAENVAVYIWEEIPGSGQ